jgi:hypothetical protein
MMDYKKYMETFGKQPGASPSSGSMPYTPINIGPISRPRGQGIKELGPIQMTPPSSGLGGMSDPIWDAIESNDINLVKSMIMERNPFYAIPQNAKALDRYVESLISRGRPLAPRKWGEERYGERYPQIEGPGNPSWERRNPHLNPDRMSGM